MKYDTLVLNKLYIPIHIVNYKKAISLLYKDHARSLDNYDIPHNWDEWVEYCTKREVLDDGYAFLNSVSNKIAIPDIIVLTVYDRLPKRDVKYSRENVFQRDGNRCAYCGKKHKRTELTIDHIIPKSKGGRSTWDNTVACCGKCNAIKDDRTPHQAGMKLLVSPRAPNWFSPLQQKTGGPDVRTKWIKYLKFIGAR